MPNWCQCELEVAGPAARVREFLELSKGNDDGLETVLDFNSFIPYPPKWRELDRAFSRWLEANDLASEPPVHAYTKWGYLWCCDNWGTNGNARDATLGVRYARDGELVASFHFFTPWSEPSPVVLKASELFPDLRFALFYFEPLGDFTGSFRCQGGAVTIDERGPCTHEIVE